MQKLFGAFSLAMLLASVACSKHRDEGPWKIYHNPEHAIAGFDLVKNEISDATIKKEEGKGCFVDKEEPPLVSRTYYFSASKSFLRFKFDPADMSVTAITITKFQIASTSCRLLKKLPLETGHGLRLGDPISKIFDLYGMPRSSYMNNSKNKSITFLYADTKTSSKSLEENIPPYSWMAIVSEKNIIVSITVGGAGD